MGFIFQATAELLLKRAFLSFLFLTAVDGPSQILLRVPVRLRRRHSEGEVGASGSTSEAGGSGGWVGGWVGVEMFTSGTAQLRSSATEPMAEGGRRTRVIPVADAQRGFLRMCKLDVILSQLRRGSRVLNRSSAPGSALLRQRAGQSGAVVRQKLETLHLETPVSYSARCLTPLRV